MKEQIKSIWTKAKGYVEKNSLNIILVTNAVGGAIMMATSIYGNLLSNRKVALEIKELNK